jgi:hypothetical protein
VFLFKITVRLPLLLALTIAIPYVHMMLTPTKPTMNDDTYENGSEALYRRPSIISLVPGDPTAHYKAPGTSWPINTTFPGLAFFSPSTWFPSATDQVDFRLERMRLHTTFREPAYQPRRTFREALEDTGPRLLKSWGGFILETICFQIASRFTMRILQFTYVAMSGEEVNDNFVHVYVVNLVRFYNDWAVGLASIVWYIVRRIVGRTLVSLGRQTVTSAGKVGDTRLEYEDVNPVQV